MKHFFSALLALVVLGWGLRYVQATPAATPAQSMRAKLDRLHRNAQRSRPDPTPTVLTEEEINAYVASGAVTLPKGVKRVRFTGLPGVIAAVARVDFDELTAGKRSANPLLFMFTGLHDVQVSAHAYGKNGQGIVHVDSAAIDNIEIPRAALEFFLNRYVRPKHPEVGMDSRFKLPERIDTAVVGEHKLTLVQK